MNSTNEEVKDDAPEGYGRCGGHSKLHALKFVAIFAVVILLKGVFTMLLWNYLIPDLFHGPIITFPQAIGLIVLAKLVIGFKGMRHMEGGHGRHRHGHWRGRWSSLTREEREKIRQHLRS